MARSRNLSVQQFQQLMDSIPKAVAEEMRGAIDEAGSDLVSAIRPAVPLGVDGRNELVESVRMERGKHPLQVRVMAGGALTTREVRAGSGVGYDYANANEFGTEKMAATPFFWPTWRLKKKSLRSKIARRMRKAIAKVVPLK